MNTAIPKELTDPKQNQSDQQKSFSQDSLSSQKELETLIKAWTLTYRKLHKLNRNTSLILGIGGIVLSLTATIAGIFLPDDAKIPAAISACAAAVQSTLFAFPVDRRASFYRAIAAKNMNLADNLQFNQLSEEALQEALAQFEAIRLEAAIEEPRSTNSSTSSNPKDS